jgi:uncharacterized protein YdbL (DUF1318 family)
MKRIARILTLLLGLGVLLPGAAMAQRSDDDGDERREQREDPRKAKLQERFKARDLDLDRYKKDGKVGETTKGLVEAVKREYLEDEDLKELVEDENRDRRELYEIIAEEKDQDADVVAELAARQNFKRARAGEYLKTANGEWRKKP